MIEAATPPTSTAQDLGPLIRMIEELRSEIKVEFKKILLAIRQAPSNLESKDGAAHFLVCF